MLNELITEIYQNAVNHGWHERVRSFEETCALIHSQLSEALEEFRAGRPLVWFHSDDGIKDYYTVPLHSDEKPEGIAVELIDAVIRVLDWLGEQDFYISDDSEIGAVLLHGEKLECDRSLPDFITRWHAFVSGAYVFGETVFKNRREYLCIMCCEICRWVNTFGLDALDVIRMKHAYNQTRTYRHGGKVC